MTLLFDTTSISFEGRGGGSIGQYGHSKDHRPDPRQMIAGIALNEMGRPIYCEHHGSRSPWNRGEHNTTARAAPLGRAPMWPGNTADAGSVVPVVELMRAKERVGKVCVEADRGFIRAATLQALEQMDPPVHDVVGVRARRSRQMAGSCPGAARLQGPVPAQGQRGGGWGMPLCGLSQRGGECDATIRGHGFCSFPALCLKRELEPRLEQKGLGARWAEVLRRLDNLPQAGAAPARRPVFASQPTGGRCLAGREGGLERLCRRLFRGSV